MARINAFGIDDIIGDISAELHRYPKIHEEMLNAGAEVLEKEFKQQMLMFGIYDRGTTHDSITHSRVRYAAGGHYIEIHPQGIRKKDYDHKQRMRNAEVAYLAEYGTSKVPARPFMSTAISVAADNVAEAMMKIWKGRDGE